MGTIGIIARRVTKEFIQFGRGGYGGYYSSMGKKILEWYAPNGDKGVEYLFSLGQLNRLGVPGSEKDKYPLLLSHEKRYEPHYMGFSETDIFYGMFCDGVGYFYDLDRQWYYVYPGDFIIKIPLWYLDKHVGENEDEYDFVRKIEYRIYKKIFVDYPLEDEDFRILIEDKGNEIYNEFLKDDYMKHEAYRKYNNFLQYFDKWVLIKPIDDNNVSIILKKKINKHIETMNW